MTQKEYKAFEQKLQKLEEAEKYGEAIEQILALPKEDLTDELISKLGRIYNNDQQFENAYKTLMLVEDSQKNDAHWHYRLGYALYYLHRLPEALASFKNALAIYEEDEDTSEWIEICQQEIENLEKIEIKRQNYVPNEIIDLPTAYNNFWTWFQENEKAFWSVVKNHKNVEEDFFDKMAPKLKEIKEGIFYVTGMCDDNTVELILTADGNTHNVVFVEELIAAAPKLFGWMFTALKPSLDVEDTNIEMAGHSFNAKNISFYANEHAEYPDEIDITIVHHDLNEKNSKAVQNGTYIFLDNYLGELDFLINIDTLKIVGPDNAQGELIPIEKLKSYLTWRQKEFVEKHEGVRYDTDNDSYSMLEATLKSGNKLLAIVNVELLKWDSKASHPWMATLILKYEDDGNGMPDKADYELLNAIEDEIVNELKDFDGYLNIGRQTADGEREIYFACKDFREPSKKFYAIQQKYANRFEIEYDIYKDKYWTSFKRFGIK